MHLYFARSEPSDRKLHAAEVDLGSTECMRKSSREISASIYSISNVERVVAIVVNLLRYLSLREDVYTWSL